MKKVNVDNVAVQDIAVADGAEIVAVNSKLPKLARVWEIDAMRGVLILLVVLDHLFYDISMMRSNFNIEFWQQLGQYAYNYRSNTGNFLGILRGELHYSFVMCFVLLSGISSSFSRCNWVRGIKMAAFALLLTAVTNVAGNVLNISGMAINFNVLHVLAICILVYTLLEFVWSKLNNRWSKNIFGWVVMLFILFCFVIGYYYLSSPNSTESLFSMLFVKPTSAYALSPADYLSLFPAMGWFLGGVYLGKCLYPQRATLFPNAYAKVFKPLTVCGSYSLWIYLGSQVVMYGLLYFFAVILGVM